MDEMDMNAPQSSLNPLNPNDPILPNGVPASDQKTLTQIGAALYLTIWILAFGLPSESFKRKHKPAIIAYAIFQILLVMFVILPEKEREAAASFKRAVAKARRSGAIY
ncbi:hypothetical protein C7445_11049 [Alicyclobacillus sacchari]|uniref:Uncharacterized protein n=1 Tax=Alicyclobacillus sacchari TaxID=392010 RepID=A0A4R8LJL2_9BACL|nr:hypothetical protein [Alicyclobacillus sacchari]TDY44005.1 hypothetical protein C7445_11049 [Alicyclobacillus sacchari]